MMRGSQIISTPRSVSSRINRPAPCFRVMMARGAGTVALVPVAAAADQVAELIEPLTHPLSPRGIQAGGAIAQGPGERLERRRCPGEGRLARHQRGTPKGAGKAQGLDGVAGVGAGEKGLQPIQTLA